MCLLEVYGNRLDCRMGQCYSIGGGKGVSNNCCFTDCWTCCDCEPCEDCLEIRNDEKDGHVIPLPTLPEHLGMKSIINY